MKRIYTLKAESISRMNWKESCTRVIEMEEDDSLYSLHLAIQKDVHFDNDHLFSFYVGRSWRNSIQSFTDDSWKESPDNFAEITLNQVYPLENKKLYYQFDFGDNWIFEIRKKRGSKDADPKVKYPRLVESIGPNPEQYPVYDEEDEEE